MANTLTRISAKDSNTLAIVADDNVASIIKFLDFQKQAFAIVCFSCSFMFMLSSLQKYSKV